MEAGEIGDFESGMMAKLLGTVPAVLFGGSMTLLLVLLTYYKTRGLLSLSLKNIHPGVVGVAVEKG